MALPNTICSGEKPSRLDKSSWLESTVVGSDQTLQDLGLDSHDHSVTTSVFYLAMSFYSTFLPWPSRDESLDVHLLQCYGPGFRAKLTCRV